MPETLGQLIQHRREATGLSQGALQKALGEEGVSVTRGAVGLWETDRRVPRFGHLAVIAFLLGFTDADKAHAFDLARDSAPSAA